LYDADHFIEKPFFRYLNVLMKLKFFIPSPYEFLFPFFWLVRSY
jgi:hypothetical protein